MAAENTRVANQARGLEGSGLTFHDHQRQRVAAEWALDSGKPNCERALNVQARLKTGSQTADLQEVKRPLTLAVQPPTNV